MNLAKCEISYLFETTVAKETIDKLTSNNL